ncbi:MAG: GSCFA domain-containing protein [Bacteroidales bacterium]|nr:GSCFA domain-containing protein [Bacteroidales bacterium]
MLRLQTPVTDERCKVGISYSDKIMMLGSCFSENIGVQLKNFGFDVCINPFGVLYNPVSVLNSVERMLDIRQFSLEDCIQIGAGDTRFCSFSHHTSFAREEAETFLLDANVALEEAAEHFRKCNKVIITLGTSWCFRHLERDFIVSNCLKRPAAEFRRERLTVQETAAALQRIIDLCAVRAAEDPGFAPKQFIFTVSPIRHFKDGAHGNQISKSTLLLGIEEVVSGLSALSNCPEGKGVTADYFPAYEIVMDELRDYRFYAEDMCHPSSQTVDYIRERFLAWALPPEEHQLLEENIRRFKHSHHRPH